MRMRLKMMVSVLICMIIYPTIIDAAPEELRYQASILPASSGAADGSYGFLELSDEVLGQTRENTPDIRLYAGNEEIPYTLVDSTSSGEEKKSVRVEMFNQGRDSRGNQIIEGQTKERSSELRNSIDKDGIQEVILELKSPNLPVKELEVITHDKNFTRKIELYGSQTGESWDFITRGELYDYQLDKASALNRGLKFKGDSRFYKLKIYNLDNQPLEVLEVKLRGDNPLLVFPVTEDESLTLYWGNAELRAPSYDLEKLLPNLDFAKMSLYTISEGEENLKYKITDSRPWTERHSGLLNTVLVLAVFALLGIIAKSLKKVHFKE